MARNARSRKRDYRAPHVPFTMERVGSTPLSVSGPDGRPYIMRRLSGGTKDYICPACGSTVRAGEGHVVAWPTDSLFGPDDNLAQRRHWHTYCWDRRLRPLH